ncbi:hypothetical protein VKT23_004919 [Stygiomarasmius scandens]|uniref:Deacetylase sirtuin-type domain-containing protein n=1 Tax=Marasmiellus scandens TaxID=2682957 RepID=A0ABR1JRL8_9AGAR
MGSDNIEEFRRVLLSSKKIIVLSGAGLSAASGIPTFRGVGGLWRKHDPMTLVSVNAFQENQSRIWQFNHYRRDMILKASPNAAHYVLARLSISELRRKIAPNSEFTHITQNVDGFSIKAIEETISGLETKPTGPVSEVIEMHGRLFDVACTAHDCDYRKTDYTTPLCPALAGTERALADDEPEPVIKRKDLPHCPQCNQLCRPGTVWFGEKPHRIHEVLALAEEADLCIIIGTSGLVQPASKIGTMVKSHGGKVALFNIEASNHSEEADFLFLGPCEVRLGEVIGI